RFRLGEQWLGIREVVDRWYDFGAVYCRVQAEDGAAYILKHVDGSDVWTLDAFRAQKAAGDTSSRSGRDGGLLVLPTPPSDFTTAVPTLSFDSHSLRMCTLRRCKIQRRTGPPQSD